MFYEASEIDNLIICKICDLKLEGKIKKKDSLLD
jgi:hypothetical protein